MGAVLNRRVEIDAPKPANRDGVAGLSTTIRVFDGNKQIGEGDSFVDSQLVDLMGPDYARREAEELAEHIV